MIDENKSAHKVYDWIGRCLQKYKNSGVEYFHQPRALSITYLLRLAQKKPKTFGVTSVAEAVGCKPFTSYTVECNRCVCGADSIEYCTRMSCLVPETTRSDENSDYSKQD
ncbi:unnamed protein product [Leptidea sinapis]|uniref:Pacifastin domain-containing protein n=1 Tax=Leptidea sinapis TaxID=189913 RepID=A0A5E4PSG4_9NEOP|nr:unnamed protein product [Leptidea sinapis]